MRVPRLRNHRRGCPPARWRRPGGALHAGVDGLWLAVGLGGVLVLVGLPTAPALVDALVDALGASPAVAAYAVDYLRIAVLGVPAMLLVLAGTGLLRGLQDTRTPLAVAACASLLNLALNAVLVLGLGWGIAGSAWGTTVTQYAAAGAYLVVVARGVRAHGVPLRPYLPGVRCAAAAGAHLVVRTLSLRGLRPGDRGRRPPRRRRVRRAPGRLRRLVPAGLGPRRGRDRRSGPRQAHPRGERGRADPGGHRANGRVGSRRSGWGSARPCSPCTPRCPRCPPPTRGCGR
ncbi:MAG TPA: MATE family efflux transporter [Mycobacteriales bacterium]|nr:MATE family efflux transporter [Mycobacteriales bacterium]